jgi:methionine sulfoxide reductase catalytic subunit
MAGYRQRLSRGEDVVDPENWAGRLPAAHGIAPRVRVGRDRWFNLLWLLPIGWLALIAAVAAAQGLRNMPAVQHFMACYPVAVSAMATCPVSVTNRRNAALVTR